MKAAFLGCWAVVAVSVLAGQTPQRTATILRPSADDVLTGKVVLEIEVPRTGGDVEEVVFQVDGREACRLIERPFRCEFDAGNQTSVRTVRAVVTWVDGGEPLVRNVRTRGRAVFKSGAEGVIVSARVTDSRGRFVPGLTTADFIVREDGVEQDATLLGAEQVSTQVLLALDISASMRESMTVLQQAARSFLGALRGADAVSVTAFNTDRFVVVPWGPLPAAREASLDEVRAWGGTAIYDAMIRGADSLKSRVGRPRVLVLFTDGEDVASRGSLENAQVALQTQDVLLYLIAQGRAERDRELRRQLDSLARSTGGRALFASSIGSLVGQFAEVVEDLSQVYLLAYDPKRPMGDGKWRQLTVESPNKSLRIRARQGYFAARRD